MKFPRYLLSICFLTLLSISTIQAQVTLEIKAGDYVRVGTPIKVILEEEDALDANLAKLQLNNQVIVGQVCELGLESLRELGDSADSSNLRELHFILPEMAKGKTVQVQVTFGVTDQGKQKGFHFEDKEGVHTDLKLGDRPIMRYMYEALDTSSDKRIGETYKVYHHVYDPLGERFVTKGPGGLFPHHRGLFYGFNKISYSVDGKPMTADVWHCRSGESQAHVKVLSEVAGDVIGRHLLKIDWKGKDGIPFATELRELTAYNLEHGVMVGFASKLQTLVGDIKLAGDPQHAGFQFRGSQEIPDKTAAETYYVRPDGIGQPGAFRNWPGNKGHVNLKWNALCFVLGEQRLTCCYLDHPQNPKEARFSERNYGRFGSYFEYTVKPSRPLNLNYRIWLQYEAMTVEGVEKYSHDFVSPPMVTQK